MHNDLTTLKALWPSFLESMGMRKTMVFKVLA
jgi:hypothetical protein